MERHIAFNMFGTLNIEKMLLLSKVIYKFNAILFKILARFLDIGKMIIKFIWKGKQTRIAKNNFEKKNKVEGITDTIEYYSAKNKNKHLRPETP